MVDPDDHHLWVSLGCAAENLLLDAGSREHSGDLHFNPANGGSVAFAFKRGMAVNSVLSDAIPKRQSTRADFSGKAVSAADLQTLAAAAAVSGVDLVLVTDRPQINRVRDLVVAGNSVQMADAANRQYRIITGLKSEIFSIASSAKEACEIAAKAMVKGEPVRIEDPDHNIVSMERLDDAESK